MLLFLRHGALRRCSIRLYIQDRLYLYHKMKLFQPKKKCNRKENHQKYYYENGSIPICVLYIYVIEYLSWVLVTILILSNIFHIKRKPLLYRCKRKAILTIYYVVRWCGIHILLWINFISFRLPFIIQRKRNKTSSVFKWKWRSEQIGVYIVAKGFTVDIANYDYLIIFAKLFYLRTLWLFFEAKVEKVLFLVFVSFVEWTENTEFFVLEGLVGGYY